MKRYYKILSENETIYYSPSDGPLITDKFQIFNPTEEILSQEGWREWIEPEIQRDYVSDKIREIELYDSSDSVNAFILNGEKAWIPAEIRAQYQSSISAAELLEESTITFKIGDGVYSVPLETAKIFLARIQRYADACYIVTETHKQEVSQLDTQEAIEEYDITAGYPQMLEFTI